MVTVCRLWGFSGGTGDVIRNSEIFWINNTEKKQDFTLSRWLSFEPPNRGKVEWCLDWNWNKLVALSRLSIPCFYLNHLSEKGLTTKWLYCERFEPRSHFKSRLSLIVRVNVVLNRTVVVDIDWHFDNLCGSHLQSQSELYHVSWWYYILVIDLIGQLSHDVIGRLSVKPWCYWLWRLVISNLCVLIRLLSQLNSRLFLVKLSVLQSISRS